MTKSHIETDDLLGNILSLEASDIIAATVDTLFAS